MKTSGSGDEIFDFVTQSYTYVSTETIAYNKLNNLKFTSSYSYKQVVVVNRIYFCLLGGIVANLYNWFHRNVAIIPRNLLSFQESFCVLAVFLVIVIEFWNIFYVTLELLKGSVFVIQWNLYITISLYYEHSLCFIEIIISS